MKASWMMGGLTIRARRFEKLQFETKMTSIDGSDLRCNACWKSLLAQLPSRSYKT